MDTKISCVGWQKWTSPSRGGAKKIVRGGKEKNSVIFIKIINIYKGGAFSCRGPSPC